MHMVIKICFLFYCLIIIAIKHIVVADDEGAFLIINNLCTVLFIYLVYVIYVCVDFWRWGFEWNVNSHLRVVKARRLKGVWININHRQVKCHSTAVHFRSGILSLFLSFLELQTRGQASNIDFSN